MGRRHSILERQWGLVRALHGLRVGRSAASLIEDQGSSRATLYRDLATLRSAGVPIASDMVNGEARYRLIGETLPSLIPPLQQLALALACHALGSLRGTVLHGELERLRDRLPTRAAIPPSVEVVAPHASPLPDLALIERALGECRTLRCQYRGVRDEASLLREIAPLSLRLAKGQLYLAGHDIGRNEARTFKVARMTHISLSAKFDPGLYEAPSFDGAVVAWSGTQVEIAVRLSKQIARFAAEYPLIANQQIESERSGSVIVRATVAGTEEALRWVLGWGRHAEVVGPAALRARVQEEMSAAMAHYRPGPARRTDSEEGVSPIVRQGIGRVARRG